MSTTATVLGDSDKYRISPDIKIYSLMDVGFTESPSGNYILKQPVTGNSPYVESNKLKITVYKDLKNLKMGITDDSGMQAINIFKLKDGQEDIEQYRYILKDLIDRKILEKVK